MEQGNEFERPMKGKGKEANALSCPCFASSGEGRGRVASRLHQSGSEEEAVWGSGGCKAQGSCQLLEEVASAGRLGLSWLQERRALLLWCQTRAAGSDTWGRRHNPRPRGEEAKPTRGEWTPASCHRDLVLTLVPLSLPMLLSCPPASVKTLLYGCSPRRAGFSEETSLAHPGGLAGWPRFPEAPFSPLRWH